MGHTFLPPLCMHDVSPALVRVVIACQCSACMSAQIVTRNYRFGDCTNQAGWSQTPSLTILGTGQPHLVPHSVIALSPSTYCYRLVITYTDPQCNVVTQFGSVQSFTVTLEDIVVGLKAPKKEDKAPGPKAVLHGIVRVPEQSFLKKHGRLGKATKISYVYQYGAILDPATWTNAPAFPRTTNGRKMAIKPVKVGGERYGQRRVLKQGKGLSNHDNLKRWGH